MKQVLSALLFWLIIKPISLLPYRLLYLVSDFFYFVLSYLIPYRKKVVEYNISKALPELTAAEVTVLRKKFMHHFCDLVIESLKNFSITEQQAQERMIHRNPEVINQFAEKGQSVILVGGHYANWELWAMAAPKPLKHLLVGVYKRLSNAYFDQKVRESRGRFGLHMVPTRETAAYMAGKNNPCDAVILAIDQSPANPQKCVWVDFFGIRSAALFGAEKYAIELNRPLVYGHIDKTKRGHYEITFEIVEAHPTQAQKGELTQRMFQILEQVVRKRPELWLWTHKRWKHTPGFYDGLSKKL
jgi:Kdo2-lipid IVA lauroyltransferase/acyltransferase